MTNYTKTTDFAAKDALPSGNSAKIVKGSEIDTEFNNIATASATKANANDAALTGTTTFETISDGTISITAFVDEDNMASDSATLVPTQQSVKAYVDSQVTAQDLDFQADSGGALSIDLDSETLTFTGGTGIDTSGALNAVTFAIDSTVATLTGSQTLSNKTLATPVVSGNLTTDGLIDGRDVATDGTKLDGIESGATADQTAAEIKTAYESNLNTNAFTDADESKLDGIEALADVTDTANVTAAGALMDSELTNITAVKALNQGVATTDSPSFAGLTTAGLTLGATAITATGTELNLLDGVTATTAELNYVDGVTSNIQTQLDAKAPTANPTFTGSFTSPGIDDNADAIAITIDSSENVGIGTISPATRLEVSCNLDSAQGIRIENNSTGTSSVAQLEFRGQGNNFFIKNYGDGTSNANITELISTAGGSQILFGTVSTERMRIDSSGNLGLGTSSPAGRLDVRHTVDGSEASPQFKISGGVSTYSAHHWLDATAYYIGQNSNARRVRIYSGAETAGVNLNAGGTSWGTFSDERLKYDVEPVENALESLSELRTVKYRLKNVDEPDSQKKIGVVAQDLVGVLDEVIDPLQISGDDTEYMTVRYTELVPVLIKAIQEQQETITALEARIAQLENN